DACLARGCTNDRTRTEPHGPCTQLEPAERRVARAHDGSEARSDSFGAEEERRADLEPPSAARLHLGGTAVAGLGVAWSSSWSSSLRFLVSRGERVLLQHELEQARLEHLDGA